jgi:hypothetical protein
MSPIEENALRIYIAKLEAENEIMRQLSTVSGFYQMYFEKLKTTNNLTAFNEVNEIYYSLFNRYRYSDYNSFKKMTNYYHNQNKK